MHRREEGQSRPDPGTGGFSLVEAMVAASVMALTLTGLVSTISTMANASQHQKYTASAISLAEKKMEELLFMYKEVSDLDPAGNPHEECWNRLVNNIGVCGPPDNEDNFYTLRWLITPDVPISGMRLVRMEIHWREGGKNRSLTFSTWRD